MIVNIDDRTAKGCNAVKHCIKRYWEKKEVPEDTDTVCGICKDMVQQARDQLESNQTQQDLKDVFEGSCKLIHIKPIVKECINIVDEFIPELVETLASQMNPSVVCSVAGLCNSAHIDKLLAEHQSVLPKVKTDYLKINCAFIKSFRSVFISQWLPETLPFKINCMPTIIE